MEDKRAGTTLLIVALLFILGGIGFVWYVKRPKPPVALSAVGPSRECLANVKQLAVGLALYAADYNDHYPAANWITVTVPYTKNSFVCPDATGGPSYAFNQHVSGGPSTYIANADWVPLVFDSDVVGPNPTGKSGFDVALRHAGGAYVARMDTSAKWCDPAAMKTLVWTPNPYPFATAGSVSPSIRPAKKTPAKGKPGGKVTNPRSPARAAHPAQKARPPAPRTSRR